MIACNHVSRALDEVEHDPHIPATKWKGICHTNTMGIHPHTAHHFEAHTHTHTISALSSHIPICFAQRFDCVKISAITSEDTDDNGAEV